MRGSKSWSQQGKIYYDAGKYKLVAPKGIDTFRTKADAILTRDIMMPEYHQDKPVVL